MSEEYEKFLNWCEDKWVLDYRWKKLLSKLSNDDKDFLKNQYEARLKADMVVMFEELYMEIEELDNPLDYDFEGYDTCVVDCEKLIQQKINSLKEGADESI